MKKKIIVISIIVILLGVIGYLSFNVYKLNKTVEDKSNWLSDYPREYQEYLQYSLNDQKESTDYKKIEPEYKKYCNADGQKTTDYMYVGNEKVSMEYECTFDHEEEQEGERTLRVKLDNTFDLIFPSISCGYNYYIGDEYFISQDAQCVTYLQTWDIEDRKGNTIYHAENVNTNYLFPHIYDGKFYYFENQYDDTKEKENKKGYNKVIIVDLKTKEKRESKEFKIED